MNNSSIMSRLGIKVTLMAFIALAISFGMYLLIFEVATQNFLYGDMFTEYCVKKEIDTLENYRAYITEKEMTVQDAIREANKGQERGAIFLYAEQYDSDYAEEYMEFYGLEGYAEEYEAHIVNCSDGAIFVVTYPSIGHYEGIGRIVALAVAAVCFFMVLIPYAYHIVHRISYLSKEMEVLAGGDLTYKIVSKGKDEIAELGRDIEGMRCSVLEQMARENESVLANSQLITSLSHDLRTPLTKLTGYLEILQHKKYKNEAEHDMYLSKALDKARQMHSLSDEMFRNFQVKQADHIEVENQSSDIVSAEEMIEMLTDQCGDLQADGFQVSVPNGIRHCLVQIQRKDLQRIFDNLFSNLRKYADEAQPISIFIHELNNGVEVALKNYIGKPSSADSTGIGLPTVQSLLSRYGGRIEIDRTENTFMTLLFLKKVK